MFSKHLMALPPHSEVGTITPSTVKGWRALIYMFKKKMQRHPGFKTNK